MERQLTGIITGIMGMRKMESVGKLKNCPHCDSIAAYEEEGNSVAVVCQGCGCRTPYHEFDSGDYDDAADGVLSIWNKRIGTRS